MSNLHPTVSDTDLRDQKLRALAPEYLSIVTLEARDRDCLNYYDLPVWNVWTALEDAYRAGEQAEREQDLT